jgi:uncharacterized protein (TIGR03435 family)
MRDALARGVRKVHDRLSMRNVVLLFAAVTAAAQTPAFDVVSVKHVGDQQSNSVQVGPGSFRTSMRPFKYTPGTVSCRTTLMSMLTEAYQVKQFQIQGPGWLDQEVYELNANMPEGTSKEAARLMLQKMLADRFGMSMKRDQKEFPVMLLKEIPGTNRLEEVVPTPPSFGYSMGMDHLEAKPGMPLSALANHLSQSAGRPVLDETGRKGMYKIKLQWNAEPPSAAPGAVIRLGTDSGILSALSQVGLRLEPAKRMMDWLIIENVGKEPTEN